MNEQSRQKSSNGVSRRRSDCKEALRLAETVRTGGRFNATKDEISADKCAAPRKAGLNAFRAVSPQVARPQVRGPISGLPRLGYEAHLAGPMFFTI